MDGVQLPRGYSHFEETVYFLQFRFPVCFTLFVLLFPETPCLVVDAQPFNCLKATATSRIVYFLPFRFPVCFILFVLLFPETTCLVVGAQPCME